MLEAYQAYADFETMADLVEEMICHLAETCCGGLIGTRMNFSSRNSPFGCK